MSIKPTPYNPHQKQDDIKKNIGTDFPPLPSSYKAAKSMTINPQNISSLGRNLHQNPPTALKLNLERFTDRVMRPTLAIGEEKARGLLRGPRSISRADAVGGFTGGHEGEGASFSDPEKGAKVDEDYDLFWRGRDRLVSSYILQDNESCIEC